MKILATRYSAAGNTFFILNNLNDQISRALGKGRTSVQLKSRQRDFVKYICNNFVNFKTDGVIFVNAHPKFDFQWSFYNADGSRARMCGNAARAVTHYYCTLKGRKTTQFKTSNGIIYGNLNSDPDFKIQHSDFSFAKFLRSNKISIPSFPNVKWKMGSKQLQCKEIRIHNQRGYWINSGVPHFILPYPPRFSQAQRMRNHEIFQPEGTNVTYVKTLSAKILYDGKLYHDKSEFLKQDSISNVTPLSSIYTDFLGQLSLKNGNQKRSKSFKYSFPSLIRKDQKKDIFLEAVTYERGVENFTLSCGTGAIAAAIFAWENHRKGILNTRTFNKRKGIHSNIDKNQTIPFLPTVHVEMPGGVLTVDCVQSVGSPQGSRQNSQQGPLQGSGQGSLNLKKFMISLTGEVFREMDIVFDTTDFIV